MEFQRKVLDAVVPLWRLGYSKQLDLKYHRNASILLRLANRIIEHESETGNTSTLDRLVKHGVYCPLEPTKASPVTEGYRNKNSFSVGVGPDGNKKTVGFYIGNWKKRNKPVCVPIDYSKNMSERHLRVGKAYAEFLKRSPLDVMLDLKDAGCWRDVTIRSTIGGALMVIVACSAKNLTSEARDDLRHFFIEGDGKDCGITSLYVQPSERSQPTNEEAPYKLLHGTPHITETLLNLKFQILPDAFFQTNTAGAEVLYSTIKDLCQVTMETTLLDVCCGTGTIGIVMAENVKDVIGVEIIPQAVQNAQINAKLNNIKNANFICGAAEKVLPDLLPDVQSTDGNTVVIVNPARSGLHPKVVKAIRNTASLRKLVYVSCQPEGNAFNNFVDLCCPSNAKLHGDPFIPTKAVPVDMFPHTYHCELVILFER